jgi:chromosome partitioning protein
VFVVNDATPRARITSEAAVALSQHGTVAPVVVHHRTDFASSMIDGRTVMECEAEGRSAAEVRELWAYLAARLAKLHPHTIPHDRTHLGRPDPHQGAAPASGSPAFGRRLA